jgi:hypothetical protein
MIDHSRKTARVALPSANDAEPELSDNDLEGDHTEDDTDDNDDILADFPDDTEVWIS